MEELKQSRKIKKDFLTGILLIIGFFLLYLNTLSSDYYYDGIAFSMFTLEGFLGNLRRVFIGNHLLYCFFNLQFFKLFRIFDPTVREYFTGQILDVLCGVAGVFFLYRIFRKLKLNNVISISGAVLLGVSYVFWYFSVNIEYLIPAALLLILIIYFLLKDLTLKNIIIISILHFLLISLAIYHFLLTPVILFALYLKGRDSEMFKKKIKFPVIYSIILIITVAVSYLIVVLAVIKPETRYETIHWFLSYATPGSDKYVHINLNSFRLSIIAFVNSVSGTYYPDSGNWLSLLKVISTIILSAGAGIVIYNFKSIWKKYRIPVLVNLGIFLIYGLFFSLWSPETVGFKLPQLISMIILIILAISVFTNKRLRKVARVGIIILIVLIFIYNFKGTLLPGSKLKNNKPLVFTYELSRRTEIGDLFIFSGYSPYPIFKVYLPYFGSRQVIAISWYLDLNKREHSESIEIINNIIKQRHRNNYDVYVFSELVENDRSINSISENKKISPDQIGQIFAQYKFIEFFQFSGYTVYKISKPLDI